MAAAVHGVITELSIADNNLMPPALITSFIKTPTPVTMIRVPQGTLARAFFSLVTPRSINIELMANPTKPTFFLKTRTIKIRITKPIKVAVMGCPVNGPGEAKEADIGIAGGMKLGLIFKKGKIIAKVKEEDLYTEFVKELEKTVEEYKEEHNESFKTF